MSAADYDVVQQRDVSAPAGWKLWEFQDPFQFQNGPYFSADPFEATDEEPLRLAFRVGPHNCSLAGICHGGMIAASLDIVTGRSMAKVCNVEHAPTVSMGVDFMRAAELGDWVESRVRILRRTRSMVFCDAMLQGPKGAIARGNTVFKLLEPRLLEPRLPESRA
jgi:acyl-coenzyme A thioesterase PaaI-like protein